MGERLRALVLLGVVLAAGIFIGSAVSQWNPLPQQEIVEPPPRNFTAAGLGRVRVEVLNAGGREDMARLATDHLRDRGFDVVYFGNAEEFGEACAFLCSQQAGYITGHSLNLDGGLYESNF